MGSGRGPRVGGGSGRHASRAQDAAVAAGEEGPMMMASATNRKAEAEAELEKAAAALCVGKPVYLISAAGDKAPAATEAEAGGEAPAATEAGDKQARAATEAPATREGLTPLPKEEVERVLSWKRGKLTSIYSTPEAIEVFETLSDSCAEYQAWMRAEYEANDGVVWVDDDFLREQAEGIQSLKDYWKEEKLDEDDFDFTGWHFEGDPDSPGWNIPLMRANRKRKEEAQLGAAVHQELNAN